MNQGFIRFLHFLPILFTTIFLTACETAKRSGSYYQDDGPGTQSVDVSTIPDAVPRAEPLHRYANRPYTVLGVSYVPMTSRQPYKARGTASWYGQKFHGKKTASGEIYDMYRMTAAHPTLPLPSYARVTNLANGKDVVVRINDRGPFLHGRIIDLSYAAAHKIGIAANGTGEVEIETILIEADGTGSASVPSAAPVPVTPAPAPAPMPGSVSTAAASDTPLQTVAGGSIVQLGVFVNYANAESFLTHVQGVVESAQYKAQIQQKDDGKYRVFIGPFQGRAEAQQVADHLGETFGLPTYLAPH